MFPYEPEVIRQSGRLELADAEPLCKRSLAIQEKALGPDHPVVALDLNNLAGLYQGQGRYADAEPLFKRALAIREKVLGPDHPDVGAALNNLALLYQDQGRYGDAEPLLKRALAIRERTLGSDHPDVGQSLNSLAGLYQAQSRFNEAEPLFKRSLAIKEKELGPDHPDVGQSLNNLALLYQLQGRFTDAEPLYKRSLAIAEKALGPDHSTVAVTLNNLALLYQGQGRYADAEPLYKRALAIQEKALGPNHRGVAIDLSNLAGLYRAQGRYADAEPLYQRSLAILEKVLNPDHPDVGTALDNLAGLHQAQGRFAEAESLYNRALAIQEKALGADRPMVAIDLSNLAGLYQAQGRFAEAESLYNRALAIQEKTLGADHPDVGTVLDNLAGLHFAQSDWAGAADFLRRSTGITIRRAELSSEAIGKAKTGMGRSVPEQISWQFWGLIKLAHLATAENNQGLAAEMFETAQWARSSAAAGSLAQMAARGARRNPALAARVRERQDLVAEWQRRDAVRSAAVSQSPDKRDKQTEAANLARLADIETRIGENDKQLSKEFPDYAALVSPKPLSIVDVQSQLHDDEILVLFLDTPEWKPAPEETFIWAVTKRDSRWMRTDLGTRSLNYLVAALRCGLDSSNWTDASEWSETTEDAKRRKRVQIARRERCKILTGADVTDREAPPFDVLKANELYQALFNQIGDLLKNPDGTPKQLLVVPSGPLTQLPFQVLVTEKPDEGKSADYAHAAWLIRRNAITVLPSVAKSQGLAPECYDEQGRPPVHRFRRSSPDGA